MPWIEFDRLFIWKPIRAQSILYKPGTKCLVTTPCAEKAIAIGAARKIDRPAKAERVPYGNSDKKSRKAKQKA